MEYGKTNISKPPICFCENVGIQDNREFFSERLNLLLALNSETERQQALFSSERERLCAELMKNPLSIDKTFSYFGLMLGIFTPAAFFLKIAIDTRLDSWVFGVFFIVNLIASIVGFFSGKLIATAIARLENFSWSAMLLLLPFLGLFWGIITGAAGGFVIFIVGAFFGAVIGGLVGSFALLLFTFFHRILKKGEFIETGHFLPLSIGITLVICGYILGL